MQATQPKALNLSPNLNYHWKVKTKMARVFSVLDGSFPGILAQRELLFLSGKVLVHGKRKLQVFTFKNQSLESCLSMYYLTRC